MAFIGVQAQLLVKCRAMMDPFRCRLWAINGTEILGSCPKVQSHPTAVQLSSLIVQVWKIRARDRASLRKWSILMTNPIRSGILNAMNMMNNQQDTKRTQYKTTTRWILMIWRIPRKAVFKARKKWERYKTSTSQTWRFRAEIWYESYVKWVNALYK